MKTLKDRNGFTLIELLAVIVVLAIVTVIATQSILPLIANVGRDSFASEANIAIEGASDAMTLITIGSVDSSNYTYDDTNKTYCFTLENLNNLGFFDKDLDNGGYEGTVTVQPSGSNYTYSIEMHNDDYYVKTTGGSVKTEDLSADEPNGVGKYTTSVTLKTSC